MIIFTDILISSSRCFKIFTPKSRLFRAKNVFYGSAAFGGKVSWKKISWKKKWLGKSFSRFFSKSLFFGHTFLKSIFSSHFFSKISRFPIKISETFEKYIPTAYMHFQLFECFSKVVQDPDFFHSPIFLCQTLFATTVRPTK